MCQPPPNVATRSGPPLLNPQPGPVLNVRFFDGALNTYTPSADPAPEAMPLKYAPILQP